MTGSTSLRAGLGPALVALLIAALTAGAAILLGGGDPLALARLPSRDPALNEAQQAGYDGQFIYYIALDPHPERAAAHLDVPAYRYQRILLPLLARALALGDPARLPWTIVMVTVLSLAAGAWAVGCLLAGWGVSPWYALVYGLWVGFLLAVVVDLPEPLAYGLAAGGVLALERAGSRRGRAAGWLLLGLSLFAKETAAVFLAGVLLTNLLQRRWGELVGAALLAGLPFALFQGWLWLVFGRPGLGSGGAMATPFELIPFMGLLRIGQYSPLYLLAMALVFGPAVALPSLWGIWAAARRLLSGETGLVVSLLLLNALVIPFTPFSTFRETGGMLRFASGLVLALLLFAARYKVRRALNYSVFWIVLNVFLLKS
ncbi:MAG: hypothetical protein ACKOC5_14330 [Chloroflexota bacterium]